ncbi:hypothetical protein GQ457_01G016910 [Hibiscus cannabinus]
MLRGFETSSHFQPSTASWSIDTHTPRDNDDQDQNPREGHNPPAPPVRTLQEYLVEDLDGLKPTLTIPEFEVEHFELKPIMFDMLNSLGQFGGSSHENTRQHLKSFLEICNSFKIQRVSNDFLKMKLFPYSLRNKAKACLLARFSHNNMTDKLHNEITSFRQEDEKSMYEA